MIFLSDRNKHVPITCIYHNIVPVHIIILSMVTPLDFSSAILLNFVSTNVFIKVNVRIQNSPNDPELG